MRTIWKFPMPHVVNVAAIPAGAKIIAFQQQQDVACLWAEVEDDAPLVQRKFQWIGTGEQLPRGGTYVGTIQNPDQTLVYHLYEVPNL